MIQTLVFAIVLNLIMFVVAFRFKTDKLTDISYAVTFVGIALFGISQNSMNAVKWLGSILVFAWAVRLGSYLLYRIHKIGRDKRFDEMRGSFWKFGRFWLLQGLTAWIVMLPASYLLQSHARLDFGLLVAYGGVLSVFGIIFEGVSDMQKFNFIQNKKNKGKWIDCGLWKYSRHPNYFGEIMTWYGIYALSYSALIDRQVWLALAGPVFITFMLVGVSGIPLLEKSADARWGNDKKYQEYKSRTSVLIPFFIKK